MAPKSKKQETPFDDLISKAPKITVLSDNPVSLADMKSDTFNFSYHLGPIYDIIRHEDTQMPLTIGVYGKWGSGKTTAMRWLDDALNQWKGCAESKSKITTRNVWFYPWKYHDKEDIWRGLISEVIIEAIDINNASPKTVMTAVKKFGGFMGNSFLHVLDDIKLKGTIGKEEIGIKGDAELSLGMVKKVIEEYQQTAHPEKTFLNDFEDTLKNWLEDTLKAKNERMVIFIDDLDRCMPDIALQVLEALKLYLKIDNLIFVIGMDREIVEKAVKAYCIDKNIDIDDDGSYETKYLDKMFQVELHVSPSKSEMDEYLYEQLKIVKYKACIDERDENRVNRIYELFKHLIVKYGVRNPREVKRLINSSLIRGVGAEKIETDSKKLTFEQGVQMFFVQKILKDNYGLQELVGDGGTGDEFFSEWSRIVSDHEGEVGFSYTVNKTTIYRYLPENKKDEFDETPSHNEKLTDFVADDTSRFYVSILEDPGYFDLLILLSDKELGQLMQIEYSSQIAEFIKQQKPDLLNTDDAKIINNAISEELGKEPQDITVKDYESLALLNLSSKKVSDITFLERCHNLRHLNLGDTGVSNISSLSQLTNLKKLHLWRNQISDISAISGLINLTSLGLQDNRIIDVSPLRQLKNLRDLRLWDNPIHEISDLEGLTNLRELFLHRNQINNISAISGLVNLTDLGLQGNQISDISVLSQFTKLTWLLLSYNLISNISAIKGLINLTDLSLDSNQISDISAINGLVNLTRLSLRDNQISDISTINRLANLRRLQLGDNQISDISAISGLTNLTELYLNGNPINDISAIKALSGLRRLSIEDCEKITAEQIDDLQKVLPRCEFSAQAMKEAIAIRTAIFNTKYRFFYIPKDPERSKIMRFGKDGAILEGQNNYESSWRIRNSFLEMLDSKGGVHSRFRYEPDKRRFSQEFDPDSGTMRKHGIRDQYMIPED